MSSSHNGPSHHLSPKSDDLHPLVAISIGFSSVGQYDHLTFISSPFSLIFYTRLLTNCFHDNCGFVIQRNATWESFQSDNHVYYDLIIMFTVTFKFKVRLKNPWTKS